MVSVPRTDVFFVLLPGTMLLDLAGIAEPLRLANALAKRAGHAEPFSLNVVASTKDVQSSLPVSVSGHGPLPTQIERGAWIILIGTTAHPVVEQSVSKQARSKTLTWLRETVKPLLDTQSVRVLTVCSGAITAAEACLLDGRHCTTHHELIATLKALAPRAIVEDDRIFVIDGPVATSAGVTAGIDLALAAIHAHCGPALASAVARDLVVYWRRAGGDPQLSPLIDHRNHLHPAVHRAQDAIVAKPEQNWTVEDIAAVAFVSQRHIRRLFTENAGITPIAYVNRIRIALARHILQSEPNESVERVAERVGFGSARGLREAWRREEQGAPRDARTGGAQGGDERFHPPPGAYTFQDEVRG